MSRDSLLQYPGGDLVERGLADLEQQTVSEEALLVSVAAPRLRHLGFEVPELAGVELPYEHALYAALKSRSPRSAYGDYNALIGRIVSFAQSYTSDRE